MHGGSLRTARALVFAVALSTLVAIAYLANRDWRDLTRSRNEARTANQAAQVNERLLGALRDAETGQRGYLLTGRNEYLEPFHAAVASIDTQLATLRGFLAGQPAQLEREGRLEQLIAQKVRELRLTLEVRDSKGIAAALDLVETGRGRRTMDEIRAVSGEIQAAAEQRLAISRADIERRSSQARVASLAGCGLLLLILVAAFVANEASYKQRETLIAELDSANRASAEVRELLRTTFYSIGDGVITTDVMGRVQLMNSMAELLTGHSEAEARGKPVEEIFHTAVDEERPQPANPVRRALDGGMAPVDGAPLLLKQPKGGERFVESGAAAIRDGGGELRGAVLVFRDVTERLQGEDRLRQAAKLESLGVLAGGIAHDFNNLLVGMVGAASLLEEYLPAGAPGRDVLDTLQVSADRASRLTNQMLAYSGRGSFVIRAVDLSREAEEIATLLKASVSKNVELKLATAQGLPLIHADTAQLQQLIMNLTLNAAEAVGKSYGFVEVGTSLRSVIASSVKTVLGDAIAPGDYVTLTVRDNGHGMDEATRQRIFDPFFTTKFTGRGLGLAAVLGIVKGHAAGIEVESAPGQGSTFRVYFPAASATHEEPGEAGEARPPEADSAAAVQRVNR